MDSLLVPYGFFRDSTWIPYGLLMDSAWIPCGFHTDSLPRILCYQGILPWILGLPGQDPLLSMDPALDFGGAVLPAQDPLLSAAAGRGW